MPSKPINLAIVDDHSLFREMLNHYLSEQKDLRVVVQASDVADLFNKLQAGRVHVLLLDVFMPGLNGNDAIRAIRSDFPDLKIVVLSMSVDIDLISDMLDAGIHGYIAKMDEPDELVKSIFTVSENRIYRNRWVTEALYHTKQNNIHSDSQDVSLVLSERERKVLQLLWEEKGNKEIADQLFLGIRSVEKIRQDMKEKIGAKSTIGLLKYAINKKLIGVPPHIPDMIGQARS